MIETQEHWEHCKTYPHANGEAMIKTIEILREAISAGPWEATPVPNTYSCLYCHEYLRFTMLPKPLDGQAEHRENCVWRRIPDWLLEE